MFRQAAIAAAFEVLVYACIGLYIMVNAPRGGASGVWIGFLPLIWAVLAGRLWVGLVVVSALTDTDGLRFVVAAGGAGLLSAAFFLLLIGGSSSGWNVAWAPFLCSVLAHIVGAVLVLRMERAKENAGGCA